MRVRLMFLLQWPEQPPLNPNSLGSLHIYIYGFIGKPVSAALSGHVANFHSFTHQLRQKSLSSV